MQEIESTIQQLRRLDVPVAAGVAMKDHTTFCIGGPAAAFANPGDTEQLKNVLQVTTKENVPVFFLGQGSNVLFSDKGYPGVVVSLSGALSGIHVEGDHVVAGAGEAMADVCRAAREAGLTGLEFAYGIPGSVGGAVYMNAGAFNGEMRLVLESVTYLNEMLQTVTAPVDTLGLGYRCSVFQQQPWCILSATFRLAPGDRQAIGDKMDQLMRQREQKQPLELPSAGSAFKRPEGAFAGALIDECGLRGYRVGGAAISEKHCGFIVNLGGATCADVLAVANHVAETVRKKTGYVLEKEIRVIGAE